MTTTPAVSEASNGLELDPARIIEVNAAIPPLEFCDAWPYDPLQTPWLIENMGRDGLALLIYNQTKEDRICPGCHTRFRPLPEDEVRTERRGSKPCPACAPKAVWQERRPRHSDNRRKDDDARQPEDLWAPAVTAAPPAAHHSAACTLFARYGLRMAKVELAASTSTQIQQQQSPIKPH
ncbi:hypothetical protein WJX72_005076 [[Myrmecia] bisecta]|uniref:Uncharacterized protein n=1 Tax=[Myrmecia] bisecta TaxID=41462 RepID=A0AAW1P2N9_9CHLO